MQLFKLDSQHLAVPSRLFSELVVGKHISADLRLIEVRQPNYRNVPQPEQFRRFRSCVTRHELTPIIGNQRIDNSKALHRIGDLPDLLF